MKLKTTILAVAAAIAACTAMSDVSVEDVKCIQRYPWNGLVDIEYTIACDDQEAEIYVNPVGFNGDTGLTVFPTHFTGDGATNTVKAGKHTMVWDAKADMGNLFASKNFQIKMYAGKTLAPYVVVDLSSGPDGEHFPIRYSLTGPDISDDACRTTELWLRLIPPGTFMMGSPSDELGRSDNEDLHKVTITEPFYIGVFEVTIGQWRKVVGNDVPNGESDVMPMGDKRYHYDIRGYDFDSVYSGSFIGKLIAKTAKSGFDLPTEAQWEYACRCGTVSALYTGKNLSGSEGCNNLNSLAAYKANTSKLQKVGSYEPNGLGLYDMYGNVAEFCRDGSMEHLGWEALFNPLIRIDSDDKRHRILKGGMRTDPASACRSAARVSQQLQNGNIDPVYGSTKREWGFRISCPGNLQK